MKWYDDSASNIKIEKIPYRLLKVNDEVYDSIFERDGEYYLSRKCGVTIYSKNHGYKNFITDGFKMIYELPPEQQKEIKIDFNNTKNFLQENKTIISTIPGSEISLEADINTEYIAHRELDKSLLIKYDDNSLQDFPMEKRNYNEKIVIERLLNETDTTIGYEKNGKYYFDIKEGRKCLEIIKDKEINKILKRDGNSIELPSSLANDEIWEIIEGKNITVSDVQEDTKLKLIELWGDTWQDQNNYSVQSIGELYVDNEGLPILDSENKKQYKIEISTKISGNLINYDPTVWEPSKWNTDLQTYTEITVRPNCKYTYKQKTSQWVQIYDLINKQIIFNQAGGTIPFTTPNNCTKVKLVMSFCNSDPIEALKREPLLYEGAPTDSPIITSETKEIILPCQLMKIDNIADKLYWDKEKGKYIIEKNIGKYNDFSIMGPYTTLPTIKWYIFDKERIDNDKNKKIYGSKNYIVNNFKNVAYNYNSDDRPYIYDSYNTHDFSFVKSKTLDEIKTYMNDNSYILYQKQVPDIIETNIVDLVTFTLNNNTFYIKLSNNNLSPFMKIKVNNTNKILLPRENNFESIVHVTLDPKSTQTITFFEGGLDLKLTKGIELLEDGSEFISNQPGKYASSDYIDLVAYNPSTFTIDSMDLNLTNLYIYYYRKDKSFIKRELINFNTRLYKSNILYPVDTKYCKVAFSLDNNLYDYYKVRILRDKTKEKGFQPLVKSFTNNNTYLKSFSCVIPIKNDIERLMLVSNNYDSIDEFAIVNNLDESQKKHSYEIPKLLKPGEILSYTKSGNKQFLYKYNSTLYNSIVNVNYNRPYKEYHNIADNVKFTLFKTLGNNGSYSDTNSPYCATEEYIDISKYIGSQITLSVASLMTTTKICFYGENKNFISQHSNGNNFVTVVIPSNACFMRGECYVKTLGGESSDTKELVKKHVMVTLTSHRCDFIPYGVNYPYTLIPDVSGFQTKQYGLELIENQKYLFVPPYNFKYTIKDLENISEGGVTNDNKWKLDLFTKGNLPATLGYATLDDIKRTPFSSSTIETPTNTLNNVLNTILAYTKYIQTSTAFILNVKISVDDQATIYLNGVQIARYVYGNNYSLNLNLRKGMNKLIILVVNDGGNGGLIISPNINSSMANIEKVGSNGEYTTITIEDNFETEDIFFHNIIDGKILTPKKNLNIMLDSENEDKFIFAKDFTFNSDRVINGYINTNIIQEDLNSRTYINRVYGGESNLTLLTIGGNVCEIYFLNDYLITSNSFYSFHSKYTTGNQKIIINKIPENARYIVVVTDKENTGKKCSGIFLFPGELERREDTKSEHFEVFNNFTKEIATLPYSSNTVILKNKLPDLSKLILDSKKYKYDDINKRFIFPIKLDKTFSNYFLQYWNEKPINFLNIFIDSTINIESESKQYLINHTMNNVTMKFLEISLNILNNLVNNTLYLSVSIENSNKMSIYDFLANGSYKLQLEKDSSTEIYEPYQEVIEHYPMYLTAGGLTIESSSSYYGIRKLEVPKNVTSISNNGLTNITWNEVIGASSYILYLDGKALDTVTVPSYETMAEIKGMLSIKAKNSVTESELSEEIFIHSVPTNPYIIHIDNNYSNNQYNFRVYFKDNSDIETGYNVRYQIDNRQEVKIELPAAPGVGSIVETTFSSVTILEKVIVRITSLNETGENEVASQFILKLPPRFVWTYNEESKKIVVAWDNVFPECPEYAIRYKKKNDEKATIIKIPNNYEENARIKYSIALDSEDEMELSLTGLKEEIYYIFTKPIKVSKELDVTKNPPDNFSSKKLTNNTVEFSWIDNSMVETGWELFYTLNNKTPKTIFIPTTSKESADKIYKYKYEFPETGFINTKLRTVWELGTSNFTKEIKDYYFDIDNVPPTGLRKKYSSRTSMLIEWESQEYVESYDLFIEKANKTEIINTKYNSYSITLNNQLIEKYKIKVKTNFLGDQHSEYSEPLEFTPTWNDNSISTIITTKYKEDYSNNIKTINVNKDIFDIATKSTNKVSWNFLLTTASINQFQMYDGLISTETWNTGQRTNYDNTMIIRTEDIMMHEAKINVISYQTTKYEGLVEHFIYSPSSFNGKIEMEINKTRIVCIGDSITAGHPGFWAESMTGEITHQYPYWLDRRLKFQYEVINKGYGSDRTFNVLARFQKDVLDLSPQYCLIQIGTNDIYWGASSADGSTETFEKTTLSEMKSNVMAMIDLCFKNNIVPIIGMLIPRTQVVTDPVVKFGLYAFNEWIVEYANKTEGLNYVDFFNAGKDKVPPTPLEDPKSPGAMNPIYDGDNVYDEMGNLVKYGAGIHLNAVGYRIMAEAIPLNLFTSIESGVKMYMDEKCTIEAEYNTEDKQNPFYEIEIDGMKLTRTKKIVRYVKNIGNSQVLFSIYPNDLHNLDYSFKFKETDEGTKTIAGILTPGGSMAIRMELTPLTEDSKSSIELSLVSREFSIES